MKLIWLDLETTGLEPRESTILEVAVAEAELLDPFNYKHIYHAVVKYQPVGELNSFIMKMHTDNGLFNECAKSNKSLLEIENDLLELIIQADNKEEKPTLAGSSIHFDHGYIKEYWPRLAKRFSHRHYDVSAVKLFCESLGMPRFPKANAHRAKDDIEESILHASECVKWLGKWLGPGK